MRMALAGHEFRRTFADALGAFAPHKGAVVQEEAEQVQISLAQLTAEEEVVTESSVEVFDQGTAPVGFVHRVDDSLQHGMEFPRQLPV